MYEANAVHNLGTIERKRKPSWRYSTIRCFEAETTDPYTCLTSRGFPPDRTKAIIANASINLSDAIIADIGDGKALLLRRVDNGWQVWRAIIGELFSTGQEAGDFARQISDALAKEGRDAGQWAVFEWRPRESLKNMQ